MSSFVEAPSRWSQIKKFYGFSKPYDFNVAIPALLNATFFVALVVKFVQALIANNKARIYGPVERNFLTFPSEMFYFYIYIFVGLVLLNVFIKRKKIYWPLFVWFAIEFCLGVGGRGLAPFDAATAFDDRYVYHPLLQGTPVPNFRGRGVRHLIAHNAIGQRDTGNSPENLSREGLIYVFGGSTTYDVDVSQGETWVEKLNGILGKSYKLFNFGVPGYNTSQHVIETAFYADISGVYPTCAIYYVGWNDVRNAHVANLDGGFANFNVLQLSQNLNTRRAMRIATVSPALKLTLKGLSYLVDTVPFPDSQFDDSESGRTNASLKAIFLRNVATIAAINNSRGVKTIFIGQLLNRDELAEANDKKRHAWMPFLDLRDLWGVQAEFNELLRADAAKAGYVYIDADIDKFGPPDFVDAGHFSPGGAEKFASRIAEDVRRTCPSS
jgi:hypothetical protein